MKPLTWLGVSGLLAPLLALLLDGCAPMAQTTEAQPTAAAAKPRITILYDAFGKGGATKQDWGYAALVEVNGKRILFDTGDNPEIFAQNVKAKGVDLTKLDFVVMSHRHGDHMGGLTHLLAVNPKVKIYAPKETVRRLWLLAAEQLLPQGRIAAGGSTLLRRRTAPDHGVRHRLARRQFRA